MLLRFLYYKINVCSCIKFKYFSKVKTGSESPLSNLPSEVAIVSIMSKYPSSFSMSLPLSLQLFVSPLIQNIDTHIHILYTYAYNFIFFIYMYIYIPLYTCISSVQLLSRVHLFATPQTTARQASLSIANSWNLLKLMSITSVMPSNHLFLCRPLLVPPSIFPSIRVFSNESILHISGVGVGVSASASGLPMWLFMQWSCSYHVPVTWLIIHPSSDWWSADHVAIMHWWLGWSCTDTVTEHGLITWLSCSDHVT